MKLLKNFFALSLLCACTLVAAQWQWLDSEGHKVFSDRAPPPDVLEKNIVKRPGSRNTIPAAPLPSNSSAGGAATSGQNNATASSALPVLAAKGVGVDKDLESKKKQAADAEAAKKTAEQQKIAKAMIENCARAKAAKANLDSGARIGRINAAGEREIMDEADRAAESKRLKGVMATDCS